MAQIDNGILTTIKFSDLSRWSADRVTVEGKSDRYLRVPLTRVLTRIKEPVSIENNVLYKRITVRLYGQGVVQRDKVLGREIGTKRQFVAHAGQLIISRIDARNGAFGIVPEELDGAIVTNDFWLFDVHKALPEFLMLVLSSDQFQKYWKTQSSGTTNRQRISECSFLSSTVPMPSVFEQSRLVNKHNEMVQEADKAESDSDKLLYELNNRINCVLGVSYSSLVFNGLLSKVHYSIISRWDPNYLNKRVTVKSQYPMMALSQIITNFLVDREGKSLRRNSKDSENETYQYIGMENIEKNTGRRALREVKGKEIRSQTLLVPEGYIIYGKLRPYLNKYWENTTTDKNIICSSEFFVFDTIGIDRAFFLSVLSSEIIQCQLPALYSGARMPRITEEDFYSLQIPLPSEEIQKEIAMLSRRIKNKVIDLRNLAGRLRLKAKREFENSVFEE